MIEVRWTKKKVDKILSILINFKKVQSKEINEAVEKNDFTKLTDKLNQLYISTMKVISLEMNEKEEVKENENKAYSAKINDNEEIIINWDDDNDEGNLNLNCL